MLLMHASCTPPHFVRLASSPTVISSFAGSWFYSLLLTDCSYQHLVVVSTSPSSGYVQSLTSVRSQTVGGIAVYVAVLGGGVRRHISEHAQIGRTFTVGDTSACIIRRRSTLANCNSGPSKSHIYVYKYIHTTLIYLYSYNYLYFIYIYICI